MAITDQAHELIAKHFRNRATKFAVDATCGNGHDTAFLLGLGFEQVIAFDIQQSALDVSKQKLIELKLSNAKLILDSHANMAAYIKQPIDCAMFNFGYLPSTNKNPADKSITTQASSSIVAIDAALGLLSEQGLITLLCYPGHPAGSIETEAIKNYLSDLDDKWQANTHLASSPKPTAPILFTISSKS